MSPIQQTLGPIATDTAGKLVLSAHQRELLEQLRATPVGVPKSLAGPGGGVVPLQTPSPTGLTPIQLQTAYGIPQVQFPGGIQGDGFGQTIAVIDPGNNPSFQPTGSSYAGSALQVFDETFGIADPPTFGMYNQTGGLALPAPISGWGSEIAIDIEWAHAMAPRANLEIVEASSASALGLFQAAETAVTKLGASVVSMSFGLQIEQAGFGSIEPYLDQQYFQAALAANPYVTFLAGTGDTGADPSLAGSAPLYPSISPLVVGVGGTTLSLTNSNQWLNEIGWSYGSDSFDTNLAGGGGISTFYDAPDYQQNDGFSASGGFRTVPDVASDADPDTGVSIYDPFDFSTSTPWATFGGTSVSAPTWAGFIAIANQGRAQDGLQPLSGPTETLPALYAIPASDYHDETIGFNFFNAGPGYDLVTGRGSPVANKLILDLSEFGAAATASIKYQPPSAVQAGGFFGTVVEAQDAKGNIAFGFSGTATVSLLSGPPGASFTPVTVQMQGGVGVIDGLSLSSASSTPYVLQIDILAGKNPFATLTTTPVTVLPAAPAGTGVYYPLPVDQSMRNDFAAAGANPDSINNMLLVYDATFDVSGGQVVVQNTSSLPNKTINVQGLGQGKSIISAGGLNRDFEILGNTPTGVSNLTVFFQNLTITGGMARDSGGLPLPTGAGAGGGILMDGGMVSLSKVTMKSNEAQGATGSTGSLGASVTAGPGGPGTAGGSGQGGAIYLAAGSLTLTNDVITGNSAHGGFGGRGGTGGLAGTLTTFGEFFFAQQEPGGPGGAGGAGGSGQGGGLFVKGGNVSITSGTISANSAVGGTGGEGGFGGEGGTFLFPGGKGGVGGTGGVGGGGGIYLSAGSVTLNDTKLAKNHAAGGSGGLGGTGGFGAVEITSGLSTFTGRGGPGGDGGRGGLGAGGGMFVLNGGVTFNNTALDSSDASGGEGGQGGVVGIGSPGNQPGGEGPGGSGAGGGLFAAAQALTLTGAVVTNNTADSGGGIDVKGALTLESSSVTGNSATNGGGIEIAGTLTLQNSTITGNTAIADGGGIDSNGNFAITGGSFSDNTAGLLGGAINSSGTGTISDTQFSHNTAQGGGAIFAGNTATLSVTDGSSFESNTAEGGGAIESQGALTISSVTFTANVATTGAGLGGAIYNDQGTGSVSSSTFTGNAAIDGGAIESRKGPFTVTDSTITDNEAMAGSGGGIDATGTLVVSGGSVSSNTAGAGGGIAVSGTLTISATTIAANTAVGDGGGVHVVGEFFLNNVTALTGNKARSGGGIWTSGDAEMSDVTVASNSATRMGGGVFASSGSVAVTGGTLSGNSAGVSGGGIYVNRGALTMAGGSVTNNTSDGSGGGIDDQLGNLALNSVTVSNNTATGTGGGILNAGTMTLQIVTLASNTGGSGGAIYDAAGGSGSVTDATFSLNKASTGFGGAVYNAGVLNFNNDTIAENSGQSGGAFYSAGGTLTLVNTTIAQNAASAGGHGGGLDIAGGAVALYNTIVASNVRGTATADDIFPLSAGIVSLNSSHNLIGTGAGGVLTNGVNGNVVLTTLANLNLGALANNGGPVETMALLANSPAIDGGSNNIGGISVPTYDERGAARGALGLNAGPNVDIGAYEASSSYLVTSAVNGTGYGSIISAVAWANISFNNNPENLANPAPNTVTFDSANFFSSPRVITLTAGPLVFTSTTSPEAINGTGIANLTLSGGGASQIIKVSAGSNVTLSGMTLTAGAAGSGGAVENLGILDVSGIALTSSSATATGGAIQNEAQANLIVNNSTFSNNSAPAGGAIYNIGTATINSSNLTTNSSSGGGAIENVGTLTVQASSLSNNTSTGSGGAIDNSPAGVLTVLGSSFSGNSAAGASGTGGALSSLGELSISNSSFTGNTATGSGGAVYFDFAGRSLQVLDSTFSTNTSTSGGAIYTATNTSLDGATFTGNSAGSGGAVLVAGGLTASNATFANNTASFGGAVYTQGTLTFVNSTIAYNQASSSGGGFAIAGGSAAIFNTLVASNTAGTGAGATPNDITGTLAPASSNNLVSSAAFAGGLATGTAGNMVGVAPGIAAGVANNGGPTPTIALLAGSAAIDGGANSIPGVQVPTIDQRGAVRGPAGLNAGASVDIGGYEASSSYVVSTTDDTLRAGTLRTGVSWANVSTNANPENTLVPAPNTVLFSARGTINLTGGTLALANNGGTNVAKSFQGPGPGLLSISGSNATGVFSVASGVTASISGLTVTEGLAATNGGAIDNSGVLTLSNLAVTGNNAASGGGVANELTGSLTVASSTFSQNTAKQNGGAILNFHTLVLSDDSFTGNNASNGAAIANANGSSLSIAESTLTSNTALLSGGAIFNQGTASIANSSLVRNTADTGGAIAQAATTPVTITNTTIAFNSARLGAGISSAGPITLMFVTVADNSLNALAGSGAGLYLSTGGKAGLYNTIVALNTLGAAAPNQGSDISVAGGGALAPDSQYNLIGIGGSGGLSSGGNTSNQVGVINPGLANSLQPSGGITQSLALAPGSPALDAGASTIVGVTVPIVDQRGALRGPRGLNAGSAADIGAYEASSSYLVSTTADTLDIGTIATAVGWANVNTNVNPANLAHPAPNTIVFDQTGVFATPQTIALTAGPLAFTGTTVPAAIVGPVTGSLTLSGSNASGVLTIGPGATAAISGLTISGGSAERGGAVDNFGILSLSNDTLAGNTAGTGGAIANESGATLSVLDTTMSSNTATTTGGALANDGTARLTNATIAQNTAPSGAGVTNDGTLTLINATVAYNSAANSGGGLDADSGTATLFNSILALNTAGGSTANDIENSVSSASANNVIDDTASAGGLTDGTNANQIGSPALLASGLSDNGGPTQTIALMTGSPAINTGVASVAGYTVPTTDQRGALRNPGKINNGTTIDVGAFEVSSYYLVSNTGDSPLAGTLRSAVSWADSSPVASGTDANTIVFDPTVFNTPQTINIADVLGTLTFTNASAPVNLIGPGASLVTIQGDGGVGLFSVAPGVTAAFSGLTIQGGGGQNGGGILNQGSLTLSDSVFANNAVVYYGGGIYNLGGTLSVSNTTFSNNTATYGLGGAIDNSGHLTVNYSKFTGGVAFEGGAIDNKNGGTLVVNNSTFDSNDAIQGAGLYNDSTATITGSTFSNSSAFQGGGIANDLNATLTLLNSTIANNFAGQNGGGINQVGILTAYNTTIAYNAVAAGGGGGGIDASAGDTLLFNTLVANNTTGTGSTATTSDISGLLDSASSNNLVGGKTTGLTNGVNGNLIGVTKPLLGTLADNGGPTQTIALLAGSPALDAGAATFTIASGTITAPATDQRGALRGASGLNAGTAVDIGGFEASSAYQVSSSLDDSSIGTLRAAVAWANANVNANPDNIKTPAANTIVLAETEPIVLANGPLVLSNSTVTINITGPGANVVSVSANNASPVFQVAAGTTASISGLTITGGSAESTGVGQSGSGGGIDNLGNLTLTGVAITSSTALDGGGLSNEIGATAAVNNSTLSGNSGTTGGAIYNAGTLTLTNSTVAGNVASLAGGGIANFGTMNVVSSTIAQNSVSSTGTGGGIEAAGGTTNLFNTIVATNTAQGPAAPVFNDIDGIVSAASSYNMIGSGSSGGLTNSNSNLIVSDASAGLGALADNGGPTQTIALTSTSPALGAGSASITGVTVPTADQRGGTRPTTAIDVGAYQNGATIPTIVFKPYATYGSNLLSGYTVATKSTAPVVVTTTVATPVTVSTAPPVAKVASKAKSKAKATHKVVIKKVHPNSGSTTKFHKTNSPKGVKHVAVKKAIHAVFHGKAAIAKKK